MHSELFALSIMVKAISSPNLTGLCLEIMNGEEKMI